MVKVLGVLSHMAMPANSSGSSSRFSSDARAENKDNIQFFFKKDNIH